MPLRSLMLALIGAVAAGACASTGIQNTSAGGRPAAPVQCRPARVAPSPILWSCVIPSGTDPLVHGLSGLYFDAPTSTLFAVSDDDDSDPLNPARVLRFRLTAAPAVTADGVLSLIRRGLARESSPLWQLEAIAPVMSGARGRAFFVATENDALVPELSSQIYRCTEGGVCEQALVLPPEFAARPGGAIGIQRNQGIEGLTVSPDGTQLFAAIERSLLQELPTAGARERARLIAHRVDGSGDWRQYAYLLDPPPANEALGPGISEVLARATDRLLVLERGFWTGCGNTIRLFEVTIEPRLALRPGQSVNDAAPLHKQLLIDFAEEKDAFDQPKLSAALENFEGMTLGLPLPDGSDTLLLVADDNRREDQITALIGVNLAALPTASARRWRDGDVPVCPRSATSRASSLR